jgi:hypothetical protein
MNRRTPRSGTIEFPREGFCVRYGRAGLEVQVTEYHPEVLTLPWHMVLELASRATGTSGPSGLPTDE